MISLPNRLAVVVGVVLMVAGANAQAGECAQGDGDTAETVAGYIDSWKNMHLAFQEFQQCDDGGVAEGFSEADARLLADRWSNLPDGLTFLDTDPPFKRFVIRHLDETVANADLVKIGQLARTACPIAARSFCAEVLAHLKSFGCDRTFPEGVGCSSLEAKPVRALGAGSGTLFVDPLFGLGYRSNVARFQMISRADLPKSCALIGDRLEWLASGTALYAKYQKDDINDLIIGNENGGTLLQSKGSQCSSADVLVALLQKHHEPRLPSDGAALSQPEIAGLFDDTLARHSQAFGSKGALISWLDFSTERIRAGCKNLPDLFCPPSFHTLPKVLQDKLYEFLQGR